MTFASSTAHEASPTPSGFDSEIDLNSPIPVPDSSPWMVSFYQLMLITVVLTLITNSPRALSDDPWVGHAIHREQADWAPKPFVGATECQSTRMHSEDRVDLKNLRRFGANLQKVAEHLDEFLVRIDRLVTAAPYLSAIGLSTSSHLKLDGNAALKMMCHSLSIELSGIEPDFEAWDLEADETCSELCRLLNQSPLFRVQQINTVRLRWSVDALQSILRIMSPAAAQPADGTVQGMSSYGIVMAHRDAV